MAMVWGFCLFNLIKPFPVPANYFLMVGLLFTTLMHGLKVLMFKQMVLPGQRKPSHAELWRVFFFGVFELLAWRKKQMETTHQK